MIKLFRSATALSWLIFLSVFFLDWLTKLIAVYYFRLGQGTEVIPGIFNLTLVYNPGVAFGLLADLPDVARRVAVWLVSGIALSVILYLMRWEVRDDLVSRYALCAILGGACGNMLDRIRYDYVIDFLDFYYGSYHWPAFNIADSAISIGVSVLFLRMFFYGKNM